MKNLSLIILSAFFLVSTLHTNAYVYIEYSWNDMRWFINSPSTADLDNIENKVTRHCERVYLEATMRREYTKLELKYCWDLFELKRQQQISYMNYYSWN